MKKVSTFLFCFIIFRLAIGQNPHVIKKVELLEIFNNDSELCVINFWATWCKPCLEEMPLFVQADSVYGNRIKMIFVSFDFSEDSLRVSNAIGKWNIPGKHYLIDETDMDALINSVDTNWSGALPATWFLGSGYIKPHYINFSHFDDIQQQIQTLIASNYENK